MPDPCPLPSQVKKRGLNEKERLIYAPMSDVGGLLYDKDAVYIDVPDWKVLIPLWLLKALELEIGIQHCYAGCTVWTCLDYEYKRILHDRNLIRNSRDKLSPFGVHCPR